MRNGAIGAVALVVPLMLATGIAQAAPGPGGVRVGDAAYGDWRSEAPGVVRLIRPQDMPAPYATPPRAASPRLIERPANVMPRVPAGFTVSVLADRFDMPRQMKLAPNGDLVIAESGARRIRVLARGEATAAIFVRGLRYRPYGLAFWPPGPSPRFLYVATEGEVLRFPYRVGDQHATGPGAVIVPNIPTGYHWTRDIAFTPDGSHFMLAVGSGDNDGESGMAREAGRAAILEFAADGSGRRIYASGIRNPVTILFYPGTDTLWTSVNERDELGDNLPPDYVTRVRPGGFYGWPWYYIGDHQDPRHNGAEPALAHRVLVPDVLLRPHSAPLGMAVYTGTQFPASYRGSLFVALHGSWNRSEPTGYEVARILVHDGSPTGAYADFMTGFIGPDGAWGRPVGVAVAPDGSLLVSDDLSGTIWRVAYTGAPAAAQH